MSRRRSCHSVVIRKDHKLWRVTLYWNATPTVRVALAAPLFMSHEAALFGAQKMLERCERIES